MLSADDITSSSRMNSRDVSVLTPEDTSKRDARGGTILRDPLCVFSDCDSMNLDRNILAGQLFSSRSSSYSKTGSATSKQRAAFVGCLVHLRMHLQKCVLMYSRCGGVSVVAGKAPAGLDETGWCGKETF